MLSLVMPYWNRRELLTKTLDSLERYGNIEVVIVDDGSTEKPVIGERPYPVKLITLPEKDDLKNPCVPWNVGVAHAEGEAIVLTHSEIRHRKSVLPKMFNKLKNLGPKGYVLASCWAADRSRWYCYPGYRGPQADKIPDGMGLNFCAMMYRKFFEEIGGFDEAYRDGAGYEDNDFAWKLHEAGADVEMCADLIVEHYRTNVNWGKERFERNKRIFYRKWTPYWTQSSSSPCPARAQA